MREAFEVTQGEGHSRHCEVGLYRGEGEGKGEGEGEGGWWYYC